MGKTPIIKKFFKKKRINYVVYFLLILTSILAVYFYIQYTRLKSGLSKDASAVRNETKQLINKISQHLKLPENEFPTLATVTDKKKLPKQKFFNDAENGDKILIYPRAQKAILYRPSINKVIEVGPFVQLSPTLTITLTPTRISTVIPSQPSPTPTATKGTLINNQPFRLAIYNGSKISGLIDLIETQIKKEYLQVEIVKKANAKKDYQSTIVVDLTNNNLALAKSMAEFVSGELKPMPEGEDVPSADLLIILGR